MASKRDLQVVVTAKDEASSKLSKMNKNIQAGLKKTSIAAAATGAALALGINKAVQAYQEQERAEARLTQLTQQTTGATNEQIAALQQQASALQEVGVIGDEVTMFGQSQLATFALQTDAISTLTPAMLDMAVATKGVNASQQDMIDIGNMMGKVMQGQVGALSRVGVTFNETQAEILKTGTEMERASALAEILEQNFGGLNEKMAETSEGQIKQMQNSFGDLMEQIGAAVIPAIISLVETLKPLIESTMKWVQDNSELIAKLVQIAAVILPIITILPMLVTGITAVSTVMTFLAANPIVAVIAGIAAIGIGVTALMGGWDQLKEKTAAVWGKIKEVVGEKVAAVKEKIAEFVNNVKEIFSGMFQTLQETVQSGMDSIKSIWESVWNGISSFASSVVDTVKGIVSGLINTIRDAISGIKEFLRLSREAESVSVRSSGGGGRKSATGGNVFAGQTSLVGENGPELVTFGKTGTVIPNNRLGGMGGGTNIQINITGNTMLSESREIGEKIGDMIINQLRLQTRLS